MLKLLSFTLLLVGTNALPLLNLDGFSWAEQLVFDGLGNMFVSEAVRGELWRIHLCKEHSDSYCSEIYLTEGFNQFGGLVCSPDGLTLFAGVTLEDDSKALISVSTTGNKTYTIVTPTTHQPNGLQGDFNTNTLYYTDEGTGSDEGGTLRSISLDSEGAEAIVKDHIDMADGLWYDVPSQLLYVGWLLSMEVSVFSLASGTPVFLQDYPGCSSLDDVKHMLDDITLASSPNNGTGVMGQTTLLGADWTGRAIQLFSLDGNLLSTVNTPEGLTLKEPTSVRWGHGPGFDPMSIYVTEGGGATARQTNRRVVQIPMHGFVQSKQQKQ